MELAKSATDMVTTIHYVQKKLRLPMHCLKIADFNSMEWLSSTVFFP